MAIPVILNAAAGEGWSDDRIGALEALFARAGAPAAILRAADGREVREQAERALHERPPVLVAAGGDGTVSAVASLVHSSATALGVLPLGTFNNFARDLGIPLQVEAAVAVVARGRRVAVDLGEVNGRVFVNNSSLGLYADLVRDRRRHQRRLGGGKRRALAWAALTVLRRSPFLRLAVMLDGQEAHYRTPFLFVGNNEYTMQGFDIGRRASLQAGRLSLYLTHRGTRLGLVALALRALAGRLRQARDFESTTAREIEVATRHRYARVAADGELFMMATPIRYRIRPAALQVLVP